LSSLPPNDSNQTAIVAAHEIQPVIELRGGTAHGGFTGADQEEGGYHAPASKLLAQTPQDFRVAKWDRASSRRMGEWR
jgi:hypothetical protein